MNGFVLDASVGLALWLREPQFAHLEAAVKRQLLVEGGILVPRIWQLELINGLLQAVRRRRISDSQAREALREMEQLRHETEVGESAWSPLYELAQATGLTPYDAVYLELARRRGLPLATFDRQLEAAARQVGVELVAFR